MAWSRAVLAALFYVAICRVDGMHSRDLSRIEMRGHPLHLATGQQVSKGALQNGVGLLHILQGPTPEYLLRLLPAPLPCFSLLQVRGGVQGQVLPVPG
mmetsp:Transcript_135511/g.342835  ORF Transcript_135511/g.342835 Transcript_135511/m.342835 type:complete len:98 (-) Transcript_135511:190-483(-)